MSELKSYSLRLESESIDKADAIVVARPYWSRSHVIRLAIWVGLKIVTTGHLAALHRLCWEEKVKGRSVTLEDVLRTADVKLENLKVSE